MNSKWITFAALWIASLAAAYFVGHRSSEPVAPAGVDSPIVVSSKSATPAYRATPESAVEPAATTEAVAAPGSAKTADPFKALANGANSPEAWMQARLDAMSYNSTQLNDALTSVLALPSGRERNSLVYDLLERWGKIDPKNALTYAQNIESMELRTRGVGQVLEGWAQADPASAINWLNTNGTTLSSRMYGDYLGDIVEGYAASNPTGAFAYVQGLPETAVADRRIKRSALDDVIEVMVEQDKINEAIQLTAAMAEGNTRNDALSEIVDEWADRDPQAARAFVDTMKDDPAYAEMQRELMRSWADDDPAAAAEWLATIDADSENRANMTTSLVANWVRYDMEGAANWLNQQPQTPELDRAVGMFSMSAAQDDPAVALTWANSVSNQESRERLERMILPMLREQDNEAFEAYLAQSDYADDKKQQLRELQVRDGRRGGWGGWGRN